MKPTPARIREVLIYDPDAGVFVNRVRRGPKEQGTIAGSIRKTDGRRMLKIDGFSVLGSVAAFVYMTGRWPEQEMDHRDLNVSNDAWRNLREATSQLNSMNRRVRSDSSTGIKGVRKKGLKWRAFISVLGKRKALGYFPTPEAAGKAYAAAALSLYGEFARAS